MQIVLKKKKQLWTTVSESTGFVNSFDLRSKGDKRDQDDTQVVDLMTNLAIQLKKKIVLTNADVKG